MQGHIDPSKSIQIGIWGNSYTLDWRDVSQHLGYRVITMDEFEEIGLDKTIEIIRQRVGDSPLYITFDVDAIDPSVAPTVSNMDRAMPVLCRGGSFECSTACAGSTL